MREEMKEHAKILGVSTVYWIWFVGLVVLASLIGLAVYGWQLNLERRIQQHSDGYIQARVTSLTQFMSDFYRLDTKVAENSDNSDLVGTYKSQQAMIVQQMWQQYDTVPQDAKDAIPTDIRQFLSSHSRNWSP